MEYRVEYLLKLAEFADDRGNRVIQIPELREFVKSELGIEFPQQGLPVVMDDGEPVAVHAEDLLSPNSFFLTDYSGQMVTVQPMMGG